MAGYKAQLYYQNTFFTTTVFQLELNELQHNTQQYWIELILKIIQIDRSLKRFFFFTCVCDVDSLAVVVEYLRQVLFVIRAAVRGVAWS